MKVIVFGATGTIGLLAVRQMLAEGHIVTAFARGAGALDITHPALVRRAGDVCDPAAVAAAIAGQDAAVITLGNGRSTKGAVRSRGTLTVIRAMQAAGVERLICQSTLGAHESRGNLDFFWKRIMFGLLLRPVLRDHEVQEDLVRASGLDWTIVRPAAFADGPATGAFREGFAPDERRLTLKITRADVAAFLTRLVADPGYRHAAVGISN